MKRRLNRWWRRFLFIQAYKIMRNEYERHRDAGHNIQFEAIDEARMITICTDCPDRLP